ncbi:MAG: MOSC domain-containing protein [Chloroflexota bacterium]|nr:MOSC domain-containing protein [Chloroflexota bacterium]PLS78698.1 MAG: MOSC domain-containing protein [Chloroflexota bacterium]
MLSTTGHIFSLQISRGGVPKLPIRTAVVSELGLDGDKQRDRRHHGGPERALCLFSLEEIVKLQAEGHPIFPGSTGENVTVAGMDWAALDLGACLQLGDDVLIQISSYTVPCSNIADSFQDGEFKRISQKLHPGESRLYARVLRGGTLLVGQPVRLVEAPPLARPDNELLRY